MPISKDEVSYTYELDDLLKDVPEEDREDAAFDAGNAALGAVKSYMEGSTSPVSGEGRFKALSKDYKKKKRKSVCMYIYVCVCIPTRKRRETVIYSTPYVTSVLMLPTVLS